MVFNSDAGEGAFFKLRPDHDFYGPGDLRCFVPHQLVILELLDVTDFSCSLSLSIMSHQNENGSNDVTHSSRQV